MTPPEPLRPALFRVDDRLLHGQVALGWGRRLDPRCYLLADDELARDPESAAFYEVVAPENAAVSITSIEQAIPALAACALRHGAARVVLLVRSLASARRLVELGIAGPLNLGGLHARSGAHRVLAYIFLTAEDRVDLRALLRGGCDVSAQDLPETDPVSVESWVDDLP